MKILLIIAPLVPLVALNLYATKAVCVDEDISAAQRAGQLAMIWLFPLAGAILALGVRRRDEAPSGKYRVPSDAGDDYTLSGKFVEKTADVLDGD